MRPFRRLRVPAHAHPIVRKVFELANTNQRSLRSIEDEAGLGRKTMWFWHQADPKLSNIDAALGALGYELTIRRKEP